MAVDLNDLVPTLKREVNPPGSDVFPNAGAADWVGHLRDAFWEARLAGMFAGYKLDDTDPNLVVPLSGTTDLDRALQQAIVLYAGLRITLTTLANVNTSLTTEAGPVKFEAQKSAQLLRDVLATIKQRIAVALENLSTYSGSEAAVFDSVIARTESIMWGDTWFVR